MAAEEQLGHVVDGYRLARYVSGDAAGDVYLAQPIDGGDPVTLQLFSPTTSSGGEFLARVQRAMHSASRLQHDSIARISEVGLTEQGQVFAAMPFVAAASLRTHVQQRAAPLPAHEALQLVAGLAEGLREALRAGLVHEDLRPGNVLLRRDGRPVLVGLNMPVSAETREAWSAYRSPEQRAGKVLDARSNIYSLGAILYELLAGSPPQFDEQGEPRPLEMLRPGLSNRTHNILRSSLRRESWARFQTMQEMLAALQEAAVLELPREELAGMETMPAAARRTAKTVRRSHRRACLGLILIPVLLLACGLFTTSFLPGAEWARTLISAARDGSRAPLQVSPTSILPTAQVASVTPQSSVPTEARTGMASGSLPTPTLAVTPSLLPSPTLLPSPSATPVSPTPPSPTPLPPTPVADDEVVARRRATPPSIDGNLAEWSDVVPVVSAHRVYADSGWDGTDDLRAQWRLSWDDQYLYVAVAVEDDVHVQTRSGGAVYLGDSLEMQFDTQRGVQPDTLLAADDVQLMLSPGNFETLPPEAFRFRGTGGGGLEGFPGAEIVVAAQRTEQGYFLEAAIPWTDLNVTPAEGMVLGLALNANDNDAPDTARQAVMMSNAAERTLRDPSTWGTLRLE